MLSKDLSEINHKNFQTSRIKNPKYIHQINQSSLSYKSPQLNPQNSHQPHRKSLNNIKYVNKCIISKDSPILDVLKENLPFAKNSIQKISLKYSDEIYSYFSPENLVNLPKLLSLAKNIRILHLADNIWMEKIRDLHEVFPEFLQINPIKPFQACLPQYFQVHFEFISTDTVTIWRRKLTNKEPFEDPDFSCKICYTLDRKNTAWQNPTVDLSLNFAALATLNLEKFLGCLGEIDGLSVSTNGVGYDNGRIFEFFTEENVKKTLKGLKKLNIRAENLDFEPRFLEDLVFPEDLESLGVVVKTDKMRESEKTMGHFLKFGQKINGLKGLRELKIGFPTSFYVNQMVHDMRGGTKDRLERISLEFVEEKKHEVYEEFYVNSCIEWLATMKNLQAVKLRTTKLNYTYCSYLGKMVMGSMENIKSFVWIDDSLDKIRKGEKDYKTRIWVECKKPEDLSVVLGLMNLETVEEIEIPLVFDGLSGDFGFRRFLEEGKKMKNLKKLKVYIGFKLLEEENIRLVEDGLKELSVDGSRDIVGFVCYREMTKEAKRYVEERNGRVVGKRNYRLSFVLCP